MLNKICPKMIITLITIIVVTILIISGSIMLVTIHNAQNEFESSVKSAIDGGVPTAIQNILASKNRDMVKNGEIEALLETHADALGLSRDRKVYVLTMNDSSVIIPTAMAGEQLQATPNLKTAIQKKVTSNDLEFTGKYFDYAMYTKALDEEEGYIFYIRDNKTVINETIHNILVITIQALLWGILLAILLGFLFSRPVKNTLSRLTKRAETFANGEFDAGIEPVSKDEFGTLSKTFNDMGRVMNTSIKQMTAEKHKIEVILEHITNGVMAFDSDQNPIHINSTAMKLLEINETDVDTFDNFFAKLKAGVCMAEFLYLEKFKTEIRDIQIGKGHIRTYFVPFKMDNEKTAGVVCVFEDFTEQFNLEEVRQKFVAEVSHELKTPLTTIKTYTETLLNGYLDDKKTATSFLKTVEKETDKMTALVSNLLTLSRFDVKKFEMQKEPLDLDEVLQGLVKIFSLEAEIEDLDLIYNKVTEIPQIYADRDQIERAIKNVLSNAIKYCEPGGAVKIYAGNLYNEVYVKIEDNGKGIPKAEIEHVFERFYRVDKARTREKGGTGLGLSIAKEIIENHGGNIKIESEYGKYTRVIINLPMAKGIE